MFSSLLFKRSRGALIKNSSILELIFLESLINTECQSSFSVFLFFLLQNKYNLPF